MFGTYLYTHPGLLYRQIVDLYTVATKDGPSLVQDLDGLIHLCVPILSYAFTAISLRIAEVVLPYVQSLIMGTAPLMHLVTFWTFLATATTWFSFVDQPWTKLYIVWKRCNILGLITGQAIPWVLKFVYYCTLGCIQLWRACKKLKGPLRWMMWLRRQFLRGPSSLSQPEISSFYIYKPLNSHREIRLLRISRRLPSTEIETELIHVALENAPAYECISYTWGDATKTNRIFVNNLQFKVSANVYEILDEKASVWSSGLLWIDSICINQDDPEEKSKQVQLMRKVYQTAARVTICLGTAPDAYLAPPLIEQLFWQILFLEPAERTNKIVMLYANEKGKQVTPPLRWLAMSKLFHNPWFERAWVVQEVVVASRVFALYGGYHFNFECLLCILEAFAINPPTEIAILLQCATDSRTLPLAVLNGPLMSNLRNKFRQGKPIELYHILTNCITFKASEPRDKVFALQGLTEASSLKLLAIDYKKPVRDVMLSTALYFLRRPESMEVLHYAGIGWDRNIQDLPSWVVDWTVARNFKSLSDFNSPGDDYSYKAAVRESQEISQGLDPNYIQLKGIYFDDIKRLGIGLNTKVKTDNPTYLADAGRGLIPWIQDAEQLARENAPDPYYTGQPLSEALWRTALGDRTGKGRPAPHEYGDHFRKLVSFYSSFRVIFGDMKYAPLAALRTGWPYNRMDELPFHTENDAETFLSDAKASSQFVRALVVAEGPKLAVTMKGYLCLVPPNTEPGDIVCLILGSAAPFILRRLYSGVDNVVEKERQCYALVGSCYVHGIMDGEIYKEEHKVETFELH
jgi:hypothetical protein